LNKADKKEGIHVIKTLVRLLPMVVRASPLIFCITQAVNLLQGISFGLITMFTQRFFDKAALFTQKGTTLQAVVVSLIALGGIYLFNQLINGIGNFIPWVYILKASGILSKKIHIKMSRLSAIDFENTETLDDINKAELGKNNVVRFTCVCSMILFFYVPYFLFMAYYLFSLKPILVIAIIIIFIPTALTQLIRAKVFSKLENQSASVRRECEYYESCIVGREYFKETRFLGGFSFFQKLYHESLIHLNKLTFKAEMKTNLYKLGMQMLTITGYFGVLFLLFDALMKREISVGSFAAVFASIGQLFWMMHQVVSWHLGEVAQNLGATRNFLSFLDIEERGGAENVLSETADIQVKNVTFSYPGTDEDAIKNVSFTIKNGETIAIVGENGSGKSTLIRLITGLYLPKEGEVLYGDINTKEISIQSLFSKMSAVFQKYQRYQLTLRENIAISSVERTAEEKELDAITDMSGFSKKDTSFPDGYDTMLSREFNGVDLSGGQWQRVAIARGFFRLHDMIILDEPTAAIDPFEETRIYNRFAEISRDKTAVIVTHRLGSVKLADRILVMKKGMLVEIGTHHELIKKQGEYARLYTSQEQWY